MAVMLVLALMLVAAVTPDARAKGPLSVGCEQHIEGDGRSPRADRSRDVVRGPLTLMGARLLQRHRVRLAGAERVRVGVMLEAGHEAAITVEPESRDVAALAYRFEGERRVEDFRVEFVPCDPEEPRFGRAGTVGPRTIWAGGLEIRRPGCVRLRVAVDGTSLRDVRLPLGRPCKPPAAIREARCAERSSGDFPRAFSDPRNLTAGPLTLVGGADAGRTAAAPVIRELGWWKMPLLLRHDVTAELSVAWESHRVARLVGWGAEGEGRALRLHACGAEEGDDVNGTAVTFWSGGMALDRVPACVALDLWSDRAPYRRLRVPFGAPAACG